MELSTVRDANIVSDNDGSNYERKLGIRHVQVAVMATAIFVCSLAVINMRVAILAMAFDHDANITDYDASTYALDRIIRAPNTVFYAFTAGYLISQVPAGILARTFGAHRTLCAAILASALLTIALPLCGSLGGWMLICLSIVPEGVAQGFVLPSIYTLLGLWTSPAERGRLTSSTLSSEILANIVGIPLTTFLCFTLGWPWAFYVIGAIVVAACPLIFFLGADSPSKHRLISESEKNYIHSSLRTTNTELRVPWQKIMSSGPVSSAIFATSFQKTACFLFVAEVPVYLRNRFQITFHHSGVLVTLPFAAAWLLSFLYSWASDVLIVRKGIRTTTSRKLFNSLAHFGGALCMVLFTLANSAFSAVFFLIMALAVQSATYVGVCSTLIDLSPNFSGSINSVTNLAAGILLQFGPYVINTIVSEKASSEGEVFIVYCCAAMLVLSNLVFLIWGASETQWWNWPDKYQSNEEYKTESQESCNPHTSDTTFAEV